MLFKIKVTKNSYANDNSYFTISVNELIIQELILHYYILNEIHIIYRQKMRIYAYKILVMIIRITQNYKKPQPDRSIQAINIVPYSLGVAINPPLFAIP